MKHLMIFALIFVLGLTFFAESQTYKSQETFYSPKIGVRSEPPPCTAGNVGETNYIKGQNVAGYSVLCSDNKGYYENIPSSAQTAGFVWFTTDIFGDAEDTSGTVIGGNLFIQNVSPGPSEVNHPGVLQGDTTKTPNGVAFVILNPGDSAEVGFFDPTTYFTCEMIFKTDSALVEEYVLIAGPAAQASVDPDQINYAVFRYDTRLPSTREKAAEDSPYWDAVTRDNTGRDGETITKTTVEVTPDTWYRALINHSAEGYKFYMAEGGGSYQLLATHTTSMPDEPMGCSIAGQTYDAVKKKFYVDFLRASQFGIER